MIIYDNKYNFVQYDKNRGETIIGIRVPVVDIEPHSNKYVIDD